MRRASVLFGTLTAVICACGLSSTGTGENLGDNAGVVDAGFTSPDTGAAIDSGDTVDAAPLDAAPTTGFHCPKTNQLVTDCTQCGGNPLHCYLCGPNNTHYDVCVPIKSACLNDYGKPTGLGLNWCPCAYPSAANCPLPEQECNSVNGGRCVTCGENLTSGFQCKSGGSCTQSTAKCQ